MLLDLRSAVRKLKPPHRETPTIGSPTKTDVEVLGISTALENGAYGEEDTAEQLFAHAQTVANTLHKLHQVIQSIA